MSRRLACLPLVLAVAAAGCGRHVLALLPDAAVEVGAVADVGSEAAGDRAQGADRPGADVDAPAATDGAGSDVPAPADGGARDAGPDASADSPSDGGARDAADASSIEVLAAPPEVVAWEPRSDGGVKITAITVGSSYTAVGLSTGEIYLTGTSSQAAPSWMRADVPEGPPALVTAPPRAPVTALAIDRGAPPRIWAGYAAQVTGRKIWYSGSGGRAWTELTGPYDEVLSLSLSPFNGNVVIAPTVKDTYFTQDGGISWGTVYGNEAVFTFPGPVHAYAVGVDDTGGRRVWVGDYSGRVLYADAAEGVTPPSESWMQVTAPFPSRGISAVTVSHASPRQLWVTFGGLGTDGVWFSDDNGATWANRQAPLLPSSATVDPGIGLGAATPHPLFPYLYLTEIIAGAPDTPPTFFSVNAGAAWWPR